MISQGFLIATDYLAIAISSVAILGVCHDDEHDDDDDHDNLCRFFHFSRYLKKQCTITVATTSRRHSPGLLQIKTIKPLSTRNPHSKSVEFDIFDSITEIEIYVFFYILIKPLLE